MKKFKLLIALGSFLFTCLIIMTILYYYFVFAVFGYDPITVSIFMVSFTVLMVLAVFSTIYSLKEYVGFKNHLKENEYNLGRKREFYNLDMFIKSSARGYLKLGSKAYIISFSPIKTNINYESFQSKQIKTLNGLLADYIVKYFNDRKYKRIKPVYCYYNYSFILFLRLSKEEINEIIKEFENETFKLVKENDIRLFIQPYFGIAKTDLQESIFEIVNRASIARRIGETNFESSVYFTDKMIKNTGENEVNNIMEGLRKNEFVVFYQPKFDLASKTFCGAEALVRWDSPEHGLISPVRFINFAENSGIIHEIDMYVFDRVCQDFVDWKKRGKKLLPISINFSLYEFYAPNFLEDFKNTIDKYGVNPSYIEVEITEETAPANSFMVISMLRKIKDMGIKILCDDFGTGFSNINNIKQLPLDIIKLDKSFIDDIVTDFKSREVVKTIIDFCRALNLTTIAEGVSDIKQVEILKKNKCDIIQGYYYSKPIPKKDYEDFLKNNPFEKKGEK